MAQPSVRKTSSPGFRTPCHSDGVFRAAFGAKTALKNESPAFDGNHVFSVRQPQADMGGRNPESPGPLEVADLIVLRSSRNCQIRGVSSVLAHMEPGWTNREGGPCLSSFSFRLDIQRQTLAKYGAKKEKMGRVNAPPIQVGFTLLSRAFRSQAVSEASRLCLQHRWCCCEIARNTGSCAILVQATKKSRWAKAGSKQIKVCSSIHLPLEHLEFRYLAFGLPV